MATLQDPVPAEEQIGRRATRTSRVQRASDILRAAILQRPVDHTFSIGDRDRITLVFFLSSAPVTFEARDRPPWLMAGARRIAIVPRGVVASWRCAEPMDYLQIAFAVMPLHAAWAVRGFTCSTDDAALYEMGRALEAELRAGVELTITESAAWATVLATHLRRKFRSPGLDTGCGRACVGTLAAVVTFIDQNLDAPLSVATLAAFARVPPARLTRLFKQWSGLSPHQYVLAKRMERARELLLASTDALSEIASAAGFSSQSHMTSTFRRLMRVTPLEFRSPRNAAALRRRTPFGDALPCCEL